MEHFDVYVAGFEVPEDRAVHGLMRVFGMSEAAALGFVRSVPRMGKRHQPADVVDGYMRALRAIGAIVERRASLQQASVMPPAPTASQAPARRTSLPPPAARLSEIAREWGIDLHQPPSIPRAGNVPADLLALTADPALPDWYETDPTQAVRATTASAPAPRSSLPPKQALLGGQLAFDDGATAPALRLVDEAAARRPRASARPDHVGQVHPSGASSRPVSIPSQRGRMRALIAAGVLASTSLAAGYSLGWFDTAAARQARAFAAEGIDAGLYEPARGFLERSESQVDGSTKTEVQALVAGLERAGAVQVWAIDIQRRDGLRAARSLLIELPTDPSARDTIYFLHVKPAVAGAAQPNAAQRYLRIDY